MERKLTAIVAADVVNYSILMGQDDVSTIKALRTLQQDILTPLATSYHGRIVRVMGDGSLIVFDSALAAVQFAIEVQHILAERKTIPPLTDPVVLRMGVNLCDILQQGDEIHGDGVNVAVRLEELAPSGGICLSQSVYLQTKNSLGGQLLPIGERQLKNITDPVQVWRWQPPGVADGVAASSSYPKAKNHFHGRQILDPKVTSILIDLHMRSARLAISDCIDTILAEPDNGRSMSVEEIYELLEKHLSQARGMLHALSVECEDHLKENETGQWQSPQPMSDFVASVFGSINAFFTANLLPKFQIILRSEIDVYAKRMQVMEVIRDFRTDDVAAKVKNMIRFAFVEP
ncbi:MAG: adenylate/guanylate cyclase domain-containing protein [Alphaproteobacteria bacterium]